MTDTSFKVKNTLVVNTAFSANSTLVNLGNVSITPSSLTISNSYVDGQKIVIGNSTVNAVITATSITIANSTASVVYNSNGISSNSTVFTGTVSTAQANVLSQTLTDGTAISWDTSQGQIAFVTIAGNRNFNNPTNLKMGTYILHVVQDGTGSRTLNWGTAFKWTAGVAPVLSTGAGKRDIFTFMSDGTNLYGSYLPDVR